MSEVLTTNVDSFRNTLISSSVRDRYNLIRHGLVDEEVLEDVDIHNAFHFMLDIEIYHAVRVDKVVNESQFLGRAERDRAHMLTRSYAEAINFTMKQIRLGNTAIISYLSEAERCHNAELGVLPYTEEDTWDGEFKWDTFIDYVSPPIPDKVPADL